MDQQRTRKFAVLGFRAVGKSSLSHRFADGDFDEEYNPTIENTLTTQVNYKGQNYSVVVIDTAGQDEYSIFPRHMAVGVHGAKSLEVAKIIYEKLLDATGSTKVPLVLVGNKCDLTPERVVSYMDGKRQGDAFGCQFVEASAKENQSVKNVFETLLYEVEQLDKAKAPVEKSDDNCCIL